MEQKGPFQASSEMQKRVQEQITLLSTLFKLNHRCFKICIGNDSNFEKNQESIAKPLLYGSKLSQEYKQAKREFNDCTKSCTYNYAKARGYIRDNFMRDITIVQEKNDEIYDSFYNDKFNYEDVVNKYKKMQYQFPSNKQ